MRLQSRLVAVALLGAITHQTLAVRAPSDVPPRSFFGRFRAVPSTAFVNAIIILYLVTALLGAVVYLYFKVHIQPDLECDRHWSAWDSLNSKKTPAPSAWAWETIARRVPFCVSLMAFSQRLGGEETYADGGLCAGEQQRTGSRHAARRGWRAPAARRYSRKSGPVWTLDGLSSSGSRVLEGRQHALGDQD